MKEDTQDFVEHSLDLISAFNRLSNILCFVERASLYNFTNKSNLVQNSG